MTILQFFRVRLIRLHPLVLVVATLGQLLYLFDPFSKMMHRGPLSMVLLASLALLLLLPSPPIAGRHNESKALNGPAWSLMPEYLGNIAYAFILRRLRLAALGIIFVVSGLGLIWAANTKGSRDGGWDYPKIWMAPLCLTVSLVLGLWPYRIHSRMRRPKIGLLLLSIVLVVCFQMPQFPKSGALDWNGLYPVACVLFLFPLMILCGAHSDADTGVMRPCKFSGRLSSPIYITHIGFVYILAGYASTKHPSPAVIISWIAKAKAAAPDRDVVVAVLGEMANMSGEATSRATLNLPGIPEQMLEAVVATGKPVVLVLENERPLDICWASEQVPAIPEAGYPNTEGGDAVADVFFGDVNAGGKLPASWPPTAGAEPLYYNHNLRTIPKIALISSPVTGTSPPNLSIPLATVLASRHSSSRTCTLARAA